MNKCSQTIIMNGDVNEKLKIFAKTKGISFSQFMEQAGLKAMGEQDETE